MAVICDSTIRIVLRKMVSHVCSKSKEGMFPVFSPECIEITSTGSAVISPATNQGSSIAESIRSMGVVLYHVIAGESEFTKESYRIDGYTRPLQTQYWPLLSRMLSGEIKTLDAIEAQIGWRMNVAEKIQRARLLVQTLIAKSAEMISSVTKFGGNAMGSTGRFVKSIIRTEQAEFCAFMGILLCGIIEIFCYMIFGFEVGSGLGSGILTVLFAIILWILGSITLIDLEARISWTHGVALLVMLLYGASSCWSVVWMRSEEPRVLIDRKTGKFFCKTCSGER